MTSSQVKQTKLSYRAEVDGLRALAVISVIFYHAQMVLFGRDWFEGGFIGVDIFFVISGYLIARIILSELQEYGSFCFLNFYERRARRILPMLFLVIFVSIPYAWQRLLPSDFVEYAESVLASLFFGSNFFFYYSTTEYGADSALLKPLLHTWSLGVEEQFYLVFPLFAFATFKFFRKYFLIMLVALSLLSLQFAELMQVRDHDLNFFLPFSRFWELTIGSVLAYRELNCKATKDGVLAQVLPKIGLFLVVCSIFFFDGKTPHPGFTTVIPIIGVALIIGFSSKDEAVGKFIGSKPFVWGGLISYSVYLWHFPIFAFSRLGGKSHTNYDKLEWILLTIFLSVLSYFFVERPFRRSVKFKSLLVVFIVSIVLIVIGAGYVINSKGVPTEERLGFNVNLINTINRPSMFFNKNGDNTCGDSTVIIDDVVWCQLGDVNRKEIDFILLGDSHSMSSTAKLDRIGLESKKRGLYFGASGCPPLLGIYANRGDPHPNKQSENCQKHAMAAFQLAKNSTVKNVILIARWDYYIDGSESGNWQSITDRSLRLIEKPEAREVYSAAVERTFREYEKTPVRLVVLLQVPHQKINPKRVLEDLLTKSGAEARRKFLKASEDQFLTISEHHARQKFANDAWIRLLDDVDPRKLVVLDPTDVFCVEEKCPIYNEASFFYFDDDHASINGFSRLGDMFEKVFKQ